MLRARILLATRPLLLLRSVSTRASSEASPEALQEARAWLAQLHADTIPKSIGELTFSRSSGPGGQNVNKYAHASQSSCSVGAKCLIE